MSGEIVPIPQIDVSVREATLADVPFIDALQKQNDERVGFLALSWIENKIRAGQVLVAEESGQWSVASGQSEDRSSPTTDHRPPTTSTPLGYVISQDKYLKREELGLIVQLCVVKGAQRKLIGATLLKAAFDRAAYGCRLFCLWCAQDIEANRFWEAMGFVPLAYRAGSEKKRRVHIFWQKRIRSGDDVTPWWFPSCTGAGAMRADRIVLPIPPGKHWSDEMPVLLPALSEQKRVEGPQDSVASRQLSVVKDKAKRQPIPRSRQFGGPMDDPGPTVAPVEKPKREKQPKVKADPKLVAAARELRDRWLEHVNANARSLVSDGKYDVSRVLGTTVSPAPLPPCSRALLPAA